MSTRIVAISDPHGQLPEIPECDFCVLSGDICPTVNHRLEFQIHWLKTVFARWIDSIPAKEVIFCAGNHDFCFQQNRTAAVRAIISDKEWIYLEGTSYKHHGIKFYGSPWQNWFYDWAFNAPRVGGEDFLRQIYKEIPNDTDVIITHGPPWGGHPEYPHETDHTKSYKGNPREFVGSHALLDKILEVKPKLVVTGHIHGGYGIYPIAIPESENSSALHPCLIVNASVLNEAYIQVNDPLVFDVEFGADGRPSSIVQVTK